jgi:hypothetical protein
MTHPEPDKTIREQVLAVIKRAADQVPDPNKPEGKHFNLLLEAERDGLWQEIEGGVAAAIENPGRNVLKRVIREVAQELYVDGILIPGRVDQAGDWGLSHYAITFTRHGLEWAKGECRIRTNPNEILEAVQEVHNDHPETVTPGCVTLVQEAVHCVEKRCFRAAVVLVGVASEEACMQLIDCLCSLSAHSGVDGWRDMIDANKTFAPRWVGARKVLAAVKEHIKGQLKRPRPDWWSLWEGLPESLVPLAEAVRISRNTAAHDADHKFTYLEAAALLCGLPHQLRWIAEIQDHIQNPRDGVNPDRSEA